MESLENVPEPAPLMPTGPQDNIRQEIMSILTKILEDDSSEITPEKIYGDLDNCISLDAMVDILINHTSPKKAKTIAENIFKQMGKNRCTYAKIEYLFR